MIGKLEAFSNQLQSEVQPEVGTLESFLDFLSPKRVSESFVVYMEETANSCNDTEKINYATEEVNNKLKRY